MRSSADFLFALLVALISGGGFYLAQWGFLILRDEIRSLLRYHAGGAA